MSQTECYICKNCGRLTSNTKKIGKVSCCWACEDEVQEALDAYREDQRDDNR